MTNLHAIADLRRTALHNLTALHGLPAAPMLRAVLGDFHEQQATACLAALDRDAAALPDLAEREAARRAAEEVRDALRAPHPSASPANSGSS